MSTRLYANMLAKLKADIDSEMGTSIRLTLNAANTKRGHSKKANTRFVNRVDKIDNPNKLSITYWVEKRELEVDVFCLAVEKGGLHDLSIQCITIVGGKCPDCGGLNCDPTINIKPLAYVSDHAVLQYFKRAKTFDPLRVKAALVQAFTWIPLTIQACEFESKHSRMPHPAVVLHCEEGFFMGRFRILKNEAKGRTNWVCAIEIKTFVSKHTLREDQLKIFNEFERLTAHKKALLDISVSCIGTKIPDGKETQRTLKTLKWMKQLYHKRVFENRSGDRNVHDLEIEFLAEVGPVNVLPVDAGTFSWQRESTHRG